MSPSDDILLATIRDFTDRSGALRVIALLDREPPRVIEAIQNGPLTVDDETEVDPLDLIGVMPVHVHAPKPVPATALNFDVVKGEVEAPLGVVEAMVKAVMDLAAELGGRSVAVAEFATRDGEPLSLSARAGEPVVLTAGEQQFQM